MCNEHVFDVYVLCIFLRHRSSVSQKTSAQSGGGGSLWWRNSVHRSSRTQRAAAVVYGAGLGAGPQDSSSAQVMWSLFISFTCVIRQSFRHQSAIFFIPQTPEDTHQTAVLRGRCQHVCEGMCRIYRPWSEIDSGDQTGKLWVDLFWLDDFNVVYVYVWGKAEQHIVCLWFFDTLLMNLCSFRLLNGIRCLAASTQKWNQHFWSACF